MLCSAVAVCLTATIGVTETQAASDDPVSSPDNRVEWRANEFKSSAQAETVVAPTTDGRVVVAWSSRRQKDGQSAIFGRHFTLGGEPLSDELPISLWQQSHQIAPDIAACPDGAVWMVWQSHGQDGDGASIIARRFDSALVGGSEVLINQHHAGNQTGPVMAASRRGTVAIAWTSDDADSQRTRIRMRLFDAAGQALTDDLVVCSDDVSRRTPALVFAKDGTLAIVYAVTDEANRPTGIHFQRFDKSGQPLGEPVKLGFDQAVHPTSWPVEPAIAAAEFGWIVGWHQASSCDDLHDYRVALQILNHAGDFLGKPVVLPAADSLSGLALAHDDSRRRLVAVWNQADQDAGIFAQWFSTADLGQGLCEIGAPARVNRHEGGDQLMRQALATHRIALTEKGSLLCAWSGDGDLGDSNAAHVTIIPDANEPVAKTVALGNVTSDPVVAISEQTATPEPHEPPVFDPRTIETGRREVVHGLTDIGFTGIFNTGWNPPDPHLAVGPNHLVLMTNGAIAFFTKTGTLQFQQAIEGAAGFWGSVGAASFVFDPEALYDPLSGRFFVMASDGATGGQSFVLVAVSDDSDPNGVWHKYRFSTTALSGDTFDSPNIGVSDSVVYISGDRTDINGHPVYTFDKASLLAGQPPAITRSLLMPTSTESAGIPPVWFDNPAALYAIEHLESPTSTSVRLLALNDPLGTPSFSAMLLSVPPYGLPEDPPQMGTTVRPETFDTRFWSVAYVGGSLWATQHAGNPVRARWYQIAMNGWPGSGQNPQLIQSGVIDLGPTIRTFFSAITADADGNAALVFARSAPNEFISMCTAFRHADDPPGFFQEPIIRQANTGPYTTNRWGDYAGMNFDPAEPSTIWAHHEYAVNNSWRTWVVGFTPLPAPPPNNNCANATIIGAGSHAFTTLLATTDGPDEPAACNFSGFSNISNDVWFRYIAQCTGTATISVCDADYNSKIAAYGPCPAGAGQALACDDDSCGDDAIVSIPVTANQQYRIRVGGVSGATGSGTLVIECNVPCAPDVTNDGSVDVSDLLAVIAAWGPCPVPGNCPADVDGDDVVAVSDLLAVINGWGPCP